VPDHFLGDIPNNKPLNTSQAMGGKHDEINAMIFSGIENLFERIAGGNKISTLAKIPSTTRSFLLN
jgi:hypothetical protein